MHILPALSCIDVLAPFEFKLEFKFRKISCVRRTRNGDLHSKFVPVPFDQPLAKGTAAFALGGNFSGVGGCRRSSACRSERTLVVTC